MFVESADQNPEGRNATEEQSRKEGAEPSPSSPPPILPPKPPTPANNGSGSYEEKNYRLSKWQFWAATATLIILGIYTGVAAYQACLMRESTVQTGIAAQAAKESADTQEHSFQMERRRAEDQEEAICKLRSQGMAALDRIEHIQTTNFGKVKARDIVAHADVSLNDALTLKRVRVVGSIDISTSELGGGDNLDREVTLSLNDHDWNNLADTNQVIIDSGHVRYENGFGRIVDEPYCDGWWYFRAPDDKLNPIQGRGGECGQMPANIAGIRKQKTK